MSRYEEYKDQLLSSIDEEALEWMHEKSLEYLRLMSYYRCAMMEIETKFKVLKEEYSLSHDRNPINSIKRQKDGHPNWKVSNILLQKSEGQLLITAVRMKWLGRSGNDVQL